MLFVLNFMKSGIFLLNDRMLSISIAVYCYKRPTGM